VALQQRQRRWLTPGRSGLVSGSGQRPPDEQRTLGTSSTLWGITMGTRLRDIAIGAGLVTIGMLMAPVASQAAGTLMTIVDTDGTSQSQVDAGKLRVGDGAGNLTVDGSVKSGDIVSRVLSTAPVATSGSYTNVTNIGVQSFSRFQVYAWASCPSSSTKYCDSSSLQIYAGTTGGLALLPVVTQNFNGIPPGAVSPMQTKLFDSLSETLRVYVKRTNAGATDTVAPTVNVLIYGVL
jgi:hypothetical protein